MNRYQLAKIVSWAGTLHTRKRLQKVVFMLQAAGCPLEAEYGLHLFGPYSESVAQLVDDMAQRNLLQEKEEALPQGRKFHYDLTPSAVKLLAEQEATPYGQELAKQLAPYKPLALELLGADLKVLEVASTIAYFRRQGKDWPTAVEMACRFKVLEPANPMVRQAEAVARKALS